jgi:hypothetical protein
VTEAFCSPEANISENLPTLFETVILAPRGSRVLFLGNCYQCTFILECQCYRLAKLIKIVGAIFEKINIL